MGVTRCHAAGFAFLKRIIAYGIGQTLLFLLYLLQESTSARYDCLQYDFIQGGMRIRYRGGLCRKCTFFDLAFADGMILGRADFDSPVYCLRQGTP